MARFVLLLGIPAAGKTTLGSELAKRLPNTDYISSGNIKREILRARGASKGLSRLNQPETLQINKEFFEIVSRTYAASKNTIIIDTHAIYAHPSKEKSFVRLTPAKAAGKIAGIILVKAEPRLVEKRRAERGRERDPKEMLQIRREYLAEGIEARYLASRHKVPLLVLDSERPFAEILGKAEMFLKSSLKMPKPARKGRRAGIKVMPRRPRK